MSRMVIAGGRDFEGTKEDFELIKLAVEKYRITEIVSGAASGADTLGENSADLLGLKIKQFPADWWNLGHIAGPVRNAQMADYTDYVFLFPGGHGTSSMRKEAMKAGKKIVYDNGWK